MSDQKYKPLSEMADQIVRLTNKGDELEARLDGYRVTNDTLRTHLRDLQKRHEEATLALEVAQRERREAILRTAEHIQRVTEKAEADRDAANELLRQTTKSLAECVNDRDAALAQAAGLRARVAELAEERDMWRIRCESPEATPVRVFEGEG